MIITVHMLDGRKITQDEDNIKYFSPTMRIPDDIPVVRDGSITINLDNVLYMHPADDEEKKHMEIHGW